jgi:hypothetical protein
VLPAELSQSDKATVHVFSNATKCNKHALNCRNGAPGGHIGEDGVWEVALRPVLGNPCVLLHTAHQHIEKKNSTASVATSILVT